MIVFDLQCGEAACFAGDRFEAWFRSNADYEEQRAAGMVQCPFCESTSVTKAPMAPSVPRRTNGEMLARIAAVQAEMLRNSTWVGDGFIETARAMHCGEIEPAQVHGNATLAEAASLAEEGIPVAPLPLPVVPPPQVN